MVAALATVVAVALAVSAAGSVALTQARVASAADLAAIAAASADRDARAVGASEPRARATGCARARDVAARNHVTVETCVRGAGHSIVVTVSARPPAWPRAVTAAARAGSVGP